MIKITLQIDNEAQRQVVEITDVNDNIDVEYTAFLEMFERAMCGLGFADYELEVKEDNDEQGT